MDNRYWRWIGYFCLLIVFFAVGYSYGFVKGGEKIFDFFIGFVQYSVENGILKMEINTEQLTNYIELARKYCFRNSQGSGGLSVDCGGN